jgi:hypothetical protein
MKSNSYSSLMNQMYKKIYSLVIILNISLSWSAGQTSSNVYKPFSNPILIYGSDFLSVFQMYYKQANWEMMMKLTSSKSIAEFGFDSILHYYKQMDFGYRLRLMSIEKTAEGINMNYKATIMATSHVVRCKVVVEFDTCRIEISESFIMGHIFFH